MFWSKKICFGIDSECFESYFQTKISISKFFPLGIFSWTLSFFGQNSKKMTTSKILVEKHLLVGIDQECFESYFKTEISKLKNFSLDKIFAGT